LSEFKRSGNGGFRRSGRISSFFTILTVRMLLIFPVVLALMAGPRPSFASGIGSAVCELVGLCNPPAAAATAPSEDEAPKNSQNLAILQSTQNPNPNPTKGGSDTMTDGGIALLPDSGPMGTTADLKDDYPSSDQISIYTVREGDTISGIAEMYGVTPNTIRWANDLGSKTISEGQVLVILPISGVQHTVRSGETLEQIAKKYKSNADDIADFNGLAPGQKLTAGDEIIIPDGEIEAPNAPSSSSLAPNPYRGGSGPYYEGYYMRPIRGGVKTQGIHGHNAVDLADVLGTPIDAAATGDVIVSRMGGWNGGYGNYIVISHPNGTQTLYAHLSKIIVEDGWHVVQGQQIGNMGSTGKSTGSHLHFEIRGAVNPF
jgi:murein DD-endopeptidase MepM/ murein hydrolase activator NlpD